MEGDSSQVPRLPVAYLVCLWFVLGASLLSGCVRLRLTVRTQPANAMVYVDRQLIGPSPAATAFTFYGTRHIEIVADGFRTEKILRNFTPPWYQIPPLDFVTETLWPWEIRDERVIDVNLVPDPIVPSEELIGRGEDLRLQTVQGIATPLPPTGSGSTWPGTEPVLPPNVPDSLVLPPTQPSQSSPSSTPWQPGQFLRNLVQPGGQPVQRIPEVGGLQGGGYRPAIEDPPN